jgi:hypothetical protein
MKRVYELVSHPHHLASTLHLHLIHSTYQYGGLFVYLHWQILYMAWGFPSFKVPGTFHTKGLKPVPWWLIPIHVLFFITIIVWIVNGHTNVEASYHYIPSHQGAFFDNPHRHHRLISPTSKPLILIGPYWVYWFTKGRYVSVFNHIRERGHRNMVMMKGGKTMQCKLTIGTHGLSIRSSTSAMQPSTSSLTESFAKYSFIVCGWRIYAWSITETESAL